MTINLSEDEAGEYCNDLLDTLEELNDQNRDLEECIAFLSGLAAEEDRNSDTADERIETVHDRIEGLEVDVEVTQKMIEQYESNLKDLLNKQDRE